MTVKRRLPKSFTELEYLQNDINSYIDLGFRPTINTTFSVDFELLSFQQEMAICGSSWDAGGFFLMVWGENSKRILWHGKEIYSASNPQLNVIYHAECNWTGMTVQGMTVVGDEDQYQLSVSDNFHVFTVNNSGVDKRIPFKLHAMSIGGDKNMTLVPARRNSDSVLGLYDIVAGVFHVNEGTGSFTAGPVVNTYDIIPLNKKNILFENPNWHNLPSGYTELEYIQSSGTQYIDTGIIPSIKNSYEYELQISSWTLNGSRQLIGSNGIYFGVSNSGLYEIGSTGSVGPSENDVIRVVYSNRNRTLYVNGTNVVSSTYNSVGSKLTLFTVDGDSQYLSSVGVRYFKIKVNGVLTRNFIPAKNSSNVLGMYDLVSGQFFTNQGTGDFVAGPEVHEYFIYPVNKSAVLFKRLPDGYTELEYIESQGDLTYSVPINIESYNTDKVIVDANIDITIGSGDRYITSASNSWIDIASGGTTWYVRFGSQASVSTLIQTEDIGQRNIYELYKGHFDINGTTKLSPLYVSMSGYWNIFGPSTGRSTPCKMYSYKIVNADTGVLRFNGVPAKNSSNVVGMYDLVSNTFFTNAGTGTLIAGPEVHTLYPTSQEILYLENN